jgi:small subunit ribosomal protein S4
MKIGSKYKIARRLGAAVFEKTQGPKFALNEQKKTTRLSKKPRPKSTFGKQLIEKQKVRFTYLLSEKQFSKYVREVIATKAKNQAELLYQKLESRIDNVVLRSGFLRTRPLAKQAVSHGHFTLNTKRVNIPSILLKKGDKISVRETSKSKVLFADLENTVKENQTPSWIKINVKDMTIDIIGAPAFNKIDLHFDLQQVLEFYKR